MRNPFLKILVILFHLFIFAGQAFIYYKGFCYDPTIITNPQLMIYCALAFILVLFCICYYTILSENISENLPFLPLYLEISQITIFVMACSKPQLYRLYPISPYLVVALLVFFGVFQNFMLIGYGIFNHTKFLNEMRIFLIGSVVVSTAVAMLIPKLQNIGNNHQNITIQVIYTFFALCNLVLYISLMIIDPIGDKSLRNFTGLILSVSTWFFLCIDTIKTEMIGVLVLAFVLLIISIISKKNSIKL